MITLPPKLQVDRDEEAEKVLYERAREWVSSGERAEGIHASDLLMPRKGYWRALDPQPVSDREVGFFLVGKILHAFVLGAQSSDGDGDSRGVVNLSVTDEGSKYDEDLALWYSPDRMADGKVVEFKTSRSMYEPKSLGDLESYLQQLLIYMAAENVLEGEIQVLYLMAKDAETGKTSPRFRAYRVRISQDELDAVRLQVRNLRDSLAQATARKDHTSLPLCPAWACKPEQCVYFDKCKPEGRYGNPEYLKGKRK